MTRKVSKKSKRRIIIFGGLSLFIIFYFLFSVFYNGYKIYKLKHQESVLNNKLNQLQKEEKTLSNDIEKLQDPDYLAKYAREAFSYSKKDEIIIQKYKEEKEEKNDEIEFNINHKYIITACMFVIVIIILYIFIKGIKHKKKLKKKKNKKYR
jgi:cell division protein DivIC